MKPRIAALGMTFGLLALTPSNTLAREFHVAVGGDDSSDGSAQKPLRTISAAALVAEPGDVVTVHTGTFRERVTPARGGQSEAMRIIYRAAEGEKPEIKGSEVVKGWEEVSSGVWKVELPHAFFGDYNPYRVLIQGDWFDPKGRDHHTGEVYLNGASLWEAQHLKHVFEPKDKYPLWYSQGGEDSTTIWAEFGDSNPNAEMVEINVRPTCFYPDKPGVNYITVQGFILRHAATQWAPPTAEQIGLIGTHWSKGWIIEDNEISDSRCAGITLGKYDDPQDKLEASADQYNQTIRQALKNGWSKDTVGSHIVRNNRIYRCEQAGICGSMGAIFSVVTGNHIHDIWVKRQFDGAEIAGIKFHGAIDSVISDNHIHRSGRGLWLDWMTQGTQVAGNLLYDNSTEDLFLEVNHGPFVVSNNILLSQIAVRNWSEGGAYIHNLIAGDIVLRPVLGRSTPFLKPHSTEVAGLSTTKGGDDRWYNNLLVGHTGLSPYDEVVFPVLMEGNVFLNGATPSKYETVPFTELVSKSNIELLDKTDGIYLSITPTGAWTANRSSQIVTTEVLGRPRLTNQSYTNADGTALNIDNDYFGKARNTSNPGAGPFVVSGTGKRELRVGPK